MSAPARFHRITQAGELAEGALMPLEIEGKALVLARCGGRLHALDDRCPHAGGPLSQGSIENGLLVCPWHGREYDLASGACAGFQPVATYPVEVRDDGVYVAV